MNQPNFLPILSQGDIQQAASLIINAYLPGQNVEQAQRFQQQLFEMQKRPEAWGLILPLISHSNTEVQFFGAHTAQVKIARDWDTFPENHALDLTFVLIQACGHIITTGKSIVTLRKLYVAICSLAFKLVPGQPSQWPDWILSTITSLAGLGARNNHILLFLEIATEEASGVDMIPGKRARLEQSFTDAVPLVTQTVTTTLTQAHPTEQEKSSALKCLETWVPRLSDSDVINLIPLLIQLMSDESTFIGASDVLQEILTKSSYTSNKKPVTTSILTYLESGGTAIVQQMLGTGIIGEIEHSLCKLLVALGEHASDYIATHIQTPGVKTFMRLLLAFASLPGYYGVDEEESEMTLMFWCDLQETLWSSIDRVGDAEEAVVDWAERSAADDDDDTDRAPYEPGVGGPIYTELVQIFKRKVAWPPRDVLSTWPKDQIDKFQAYRRDVGDTLINAYYVLRDEMIKSYVAELISILNSRQPSDGWENVEAILHCIMSVQEAAGNSTCSYFHQLFGPEVLGRLPTTGNERVRRTMVGLIGSYSTWFAIPVDNRYLLNSLTYVVGTLDEPTLCLQSANSLRELCDANRTKLAEHIADFGQLHARLPSIPDSEKPKVIQSISSVIQALPSEQQIEPVEAIVNPVVAKLAEALNLASRLPEDARNLAVLQLQSLTGVAKGLTRSSDIWFQYDGEDKLQEEVARMNRDRADPRITRLREAIIQELNNVTGLWSTDATTADAMNSLIIAITSLPADMTLLSLPPEPLLRLVCLALQRQPTAVWLSLAAKLIHQLDPPSLSSLLAVPTAEAKEVVLSAVTIILEACLNFLQPEGAMEENPDIVQALFNCLERVAIHFTGLFFELPPGALDALIQYSVKALTMQERYSLVAACKFLVFLVNKTIPVDGLEEQGRALIRTHGRSILRAVLIGIAGGAPSTAMNLVDLLLALVMRCFDETKVWIPQILHSDTEFIPTKASKEDKDKFAKAVLASRSTKKAREAAQQFTIVAKGLEGSSFGYASITM